MTAFLFVTASAAVLAGLVSLVPGICPGQRDAGRTGARPFQRGSKVALEVGMHGAGSHRRRPTKGYRHGAGL